MTPGEALYPKEDYTTQPERFFAAEIVREKLLHHTSEELPYTTAVHVDRFEEDEETNFITHLGHDLRRARFAEGRSSSASRASMIKRIGTEARQELESILGAKVFSTSTSACTRAGATTSASSASWSGPAAM